MDDTYKILLENWQSMHEIFEPLHIDQFKSLIQIIDDETDVTVKLGWMTLATISESDGKWYPVVNNSSISSWGFDSKEEALKYLLKYFKDD